MMRRALLMTAVGLFLVSTAGFAHHSFSAEFDHSKRVMLQGVVTRITWENPHVFFYVDVKGEDGTLVN
jgi:hypothetical protein